MRVNPFNPQQPAKPNFFVGRELEIKTFGNFLFQTINSSPMNMSVMGDRGMGKTSLLIKFEQIAREQNCLTIRLSNYEGNINNVLELGDFLIDNIEAEIMSRSTIQKTLEEVKKFFSELSPEVSYGDLSLSLKRQKAVVQDVFSKKLIAIWEKIKSNYKAVVILIDEAETLEKIQALTFLREIFQKIQATSNYMVVLAGKLNFPEKMSETFSPLNRFFPAQRLKPLSNNYIDKYVKERLTSTDIIVEYSALARIEHMSEGHPYVLVSVCYWVFDSLADNETKIDNAVVGRCMAKIRGRLSEDYFAPMLQPLRPKTKKILCKIIVPINKLVFTTGEACKLTSLQPYQLSPYLGELTGKGVITRVYRGQYKLFHTLFKEYLTNACKLI